MINCPCCSGKTFATCCGPYISHEQAPANPEQLMRSRYTAYAINNLDYIQHTMKPPAANHFNKDNTQPLKWLKLEVIASSSKGTEGKVEYIAYYANNGNLGSLHEKSLFSFIDGCWYYTDGEALETAASLKIGRNFPCICGSGKKFKKCCQNKHSCTDHHCTINHDH